MKSLQNLSYKTLFTILFFALAGIVFFLRIGGKTTKVSAAWWDEMWHYRKAINITNSSGSDLTDFQVSMSIGTSQLIAEGKMQTDCDDIRITDINGNLLPYWIEENNPGCNQVTDTKVWLKASSLPTSGSTVYLYYGNPSAETNSNVATTFSPLQKLSLGSSYTVTPSPHVAYPDNSGTQLTNGLIRENLYQTTEATVGWNWQNPTITINLNKIAVISSFKFYLGGGGDGGINIPTQIATSYSLDNSNYNSIGIGSSWTNTEQWVTIDNNSLVAAKYGQSTITSNQWAMVGEIEIYGYPGSATIANTSTSVQSEESGGGPIAYWKFDEGVGTTIYDSGSSQKNGYFGTTGPTWADESQCISGKCLLFDGTQSAFSNNDISWNNNNHISISFWVKPQNVTDIQRGILGKQYPSYEWSFYQNNSAVSFVHWDNIGNHSNGMDDSWGNVLTANKWTHLVYTWNGSTSNFYADGKLVKTKTATNPSINMNRTNNMMFGGNIYTWGNTYFRGFIDEVKIYPYARTATQIKQDYNSRGSLSGAGVNLGVKSNTSPSLNDSLVAYWKMDEANGTLVYDSSTNKKNITLMGTTLPVWQSANQCISGKCIYINSSDASPNNSNFDFNVLKQGQETASWTLSTWFKPEGNQNGTERLILGRPGCHSGIYAYPNQFHFAIKTDACWTNAKSIIYTPPNMNSWYHLVAVYDNRNMFFYVNGKLVGTDTFTGTIYPHGNTIYLGSYANYSTKGWIDEAKIYNRALTADEVKQDYNAGSAIQFGQTTQNIGGTNTSLEYCIPGDTSFCAPPVAEWNFEENTGTTAKDTSGNNNTGTINGATWTVGKKNTGAGLNFSGSSQYITIEDSTSLKPTANITVEAWFNTTNKTLNQRMVSKTNGGGYSLSVNENSACPVNTLCFLININGSYYSASYPSSNLSNNTWYHASGSYDGTTVRLFLNGSNIGTTASVSNTITQNTAKLCIGSESAATNCYAENGFFSGKIDHVKIYNYARTPAQIAYDYNRGAPVGWWKLDECQGLTAFDSSGLGNTGAINIGPSGSQTSVGTCAVGTSAAWTNGATGKINSSLNFDGLDDYINLNNPSDNRYNFGTNDFSISIFFKTNYNPLSGCISNPIIRKGNIDGTGYAIGLDWQNMVFWVDSTSIGYPYIADNQWHQVVAIRKSGSIYLYDNGKLKAQNNSTATNINNSGYLEIGRPYCAGSINGQIDDVRIYNYALTPEQVKLIYNNGSVNFN